MVKKNYKGSLLGSSSSSSKDSTGLFIVAIVAIVAIVSLFLISVSHQQITSETIEEVMVMDENGNLVGMGPGWKKPEVYTPVTMIIAAIKAIKSPSKSLGDPDILSSETDTGDGDASGGEEDGEDEDDSGTAFHIEGCESGSGRLC